MRQTIVFLLWLLVVSVVSPLSAQTTIIAISDLPIVTQVQMPVGDRSQIDELVIGEVSQQLCNGNQTKVFPDATPSSVPTSWYVFTDFNTNLTCDGGSYGSSYHTGEDWNAVDGATADRGENIYPIASGRVIAKGYNVNPVTNLGFGYYVLVLHRMPDNDNGLDDEFVVSMYAHMENATTHSLNDEVGLTDVLGTIGETGAPGAVHLHLEIRNYQMLTIDHANDEVSLAYPATHWPGPDTQFITEHYYDPMNFIKINASVGRYADGWHSSGPGVSDPSLPIYQAFFQHGGYTFFGFPTDFGGTAYVHTWPDQGDPSSQSVAVLQDLQDGSQVHRAIDLSPGRGKGFKLEPPISDFWFDNTGYQNYGSPMSNPETVFVYRFIFS